MRGFERTRNNIVSNFNNGSKLVGLSGELTPEQVSKVEQLRKYWNYYEGYHWEDIVSSEGVEITTNFCRAFVDKFVSFELGKGFNYIISKEMQDKIINENNETLDKFLERVWGYNQKDLLINEIGQMKSVTGDAWVKVLYILPEDLNDPYNDYPKGKVEISVIPTGVVFPEYDPHNREELLKITVMYTYNKTIKTPILGTTKTKQATYKQVWTKDEIAITDDKEVTKYPNRYGIIPFVRIKNLTIAGRPDGRSDLEDLIPLNTEYNFKSSNISDILDYHAAPVTVVYGAKIGNLEKGANKMWGGLTKDAKVENLELKSDLNSSREYLKSLKQSMCEVGGIPESVLGGSQAISNTSGVALQYMNLPLIEKTRLKLLNTEVGLEKLNRLIILVATLEGIIIKPSDVLPKNYYWTEITIPDTLPKDELIQLQMLQQEMKMGINNRRNAMKQLGKEDIEGILLEVEKDSEKNPIFYGVEPEQEINSGLLNGQTPVETIRTEINGSNA